MKRSLHVALLAAVGVLAGCKVESSASIVPVGICSPSTAAATCSSSGRCTSFLAGQTFFYLSLARTGGLNSELGYFMQFDNQLSPNDDPNTGRTNTNDAWVDEVALSYSVRASAATPSFTVPDAVAHTLPTLVRTGSNATPFVTLIPHEIVEYLATRVAVNDTVLVDVTLRGRGHFVDLTSFETGPARLPVLVINAPFAGYVCDDPASVVTDVCPVEGAGGATFACSGANPAGTFTIGGTISGLSVDGLILSTPGVSDLPVVGGSTTFEFASAVPDGTDYDITVTQQPPGLTCTVSGGAGTISGADVTTISISCS